MLQTSLCFQLTGHRIQKPGGEKCGKKRRVSDRPAVQALTATCVSQRAAREGANAGSEADEEAADDALGRPDDEQLVVDRGGIVGIAEQIADADAALPSACRASSNGSA